MNLAKTKAFVIVLITITLFVNLSSEAQQIIKLQVNPQNVTTETNCGTGGLLFDEQTLASDPKSGSGGNIVNLNTSSNQNVNTWECGYASTIQYPAYCYIDLGKFYKITDLYLRDVNGSGSFSVYSGYPGKWNFVFNDNCTGYNSWNAHHINDLTTRYIRFKKENEGSKIAEIVIYGFDPNPTFHDINPPSAINNLKADSSTKNSVFLSWTTPDDDFDSIAFYELRYSNNPITSLNFQSAIKVDSICFPKKQGEKEFFEVKNLHIGTPYYFVLISSDLQQNFSSISNNAYIKTKLELNCAPYQIYIDPDMIINEFALGNAEKIADEQNVYSNTGNNQQGIKTFWDFSEGNSAQSWHYPYSALIDLGAEFNITSTQIFNSGTIASNIKLYYNNSPFQNRDSLSIVLDTAKIWKKNNNQSINNVRFIRIVVNSPNTKIGEIVISGYPITNFSEITNADVIIQKYPLMNEFIGINGFNNDPIGKLNCAGFVREYHDWIWNEGNGSSINFPYQKHQIKWDLGYWDFDNFYRNVKNQGMTICPVIQNNASWLINYNNSLFLTKPLDSTVLNPLLTVSYKNHSNFLYQIVARYGSNTINDNNLQLEPNQSKKSGLGLIKYYENWNEQNKWWKGRAEYFSPYEYAALSSADYDGHENTLTIDNHNNLGLKNADNSAKLVMGGLAGLNIDYIKAMRFWALYNRSDKSIPVDVINLHQFFNATKNGITMGVSPEEFGIKEKMAKIVQFRNKYLGNKEIWLSEFGYNTTANTLYSTPILGTCSREETQGRWIIRTFLELASTGIDKAILYRLSNENQDNVIGNTYCSSGITSKRSLGYTPKPAWYYVSTLKNALFNFRFKNEVNSGNNNIRLLKFNHDSSSCIAYAIWCPTSVNQVINDFKLQIPVNYVNAKIINFENGFENGLIETGSVFQNKLNLSITEKPIIVLLSADSIFPNSNLNDKKILLDSTMIVNEQNKGNAKTLVDEQLISGDPFMGNIGNPVSFWSPSFNSSDYPASAYIDLGYERNISQIYLYDANGIGDITISAGAPNNWVPLFTESLDQYLSWRSMVVHLKTRYIRVTLQNNTNMNEIIIYEK